jgi:hypothetical protein
MTIPATIDPARPRLVARRDAALVAGGCGLLAARPAVLSLSHWPTATLVALFAVVLVAGVLSPRPEPMGRRPGAIPAALVLGIAAFAIGRVVAGGEPPVPATAYVLAVNTLAAVAEEAWFRRLCFGVLAPGGQAIAIGGSAVLFAAVHVAIYGPWVIPIDLAAGLLLGWQRAVTGSWAVPAATHAIANVLVVL